MSFGTKEMISTDHVTIRCIDALDMEEKWKTDLELHDVILELSDDLYTGCPPEIPGDPIWERWMGKYYYAHR